MGDERWISDEPRLAYVTRLVIARALHRPVLVLLVATLFTGAFVANRVLRPPLFEVTLHYRIAEGELSDPRHAPRAPSGIRDYIRNLALSRDRVEQILEAHPAFGSSAGVNRQRAIERFRENVAVDVSRNYFILDWAGGDEPRSARVAVSLLAEDGAEALGVLREMVGTVVQDQAEYRRAHVEGARDLIEAQLQEARARANVIQKKLGQMQRENRGGNPARGGRNRPQIAALRGELAAVTERLVELERLGAAARFSSAAERENLGLTFELFDESVVPYGMRLTPLKLAALGTVAFAITLLITLLVVGSFDDRVYAPEDLAIHGIPVFGALARFPGDDAWTYRWSMRSREK